MSSAICQNFVQNAWKKELCSNCFKSKDEHQAKPKPKPITVNTNKKVDSIIKNGNKFKPKRSVCFPKDLTEVIGFGGEDWESDEDDDDYDSNDTSEEDFTAESDEEETIKELQRITKENTDFNTTSLGDIIEVKKSYTQLLLGKPLVDSEGRKQTLLVSVTPFGEDASTKKYTKNLSHIPIAKNNKEIVVETKSNVVLTSYTKNEEDKVEKEEKSLLDEITETLENSKNPIQIISRKKTQKEIVLSVAKNDSNKENKIETTTKRSENSIEQKEKSSEVKVFKTTTTTTAAAPERKVGLSRTPALKRDHEKPVVYQTSTAKIELLNNRNSKLNKESVNNNNSKIKSEVNNNNNEKTENNDKPIENKAENTNTNKKESLCENSKTVSELIIEAEVLNSKLDVVETKEKKDEINTNVAEKTLESQQKNMEKLTGLPPPVPKPNNLNLLSREQVGEPDGRADPDVAEPPALPLTPPPIMECQNSFLHGNAPIYEKPKIPSKPATVLIRKPLPPHPNQHVQSPTLTTFMGNSRNSAEEQKNLINKQDSDNSDIASRVNKRKAPKPPEENNPPIFTRNSAGPINIDSPVVREKEKRERASSCTPKMYAISNHPQGESDYSAPEPAPRKSLSISTDSLSQAGCDDRRKEKTKGRFSLKKFLRMGSNKELPKVPIDIAKPEEPIETPPQPKPRLVIVHPSELNGAKVEVVAKSQDHVDYQSIRTSDYSSSNSTNSDYENYTPKAAKPPPPPRNLDEWNRTHKPSLPHPPKSVEIQNKQRQISRSNSSVNKKETVYANIGEVRSAIVPNKPQRTASMREREAQQQKQMRKNSGGYEPINIQNKETGENVYDYINSARSSSPDSDSSRGKGSPTSKTVRLNKKRSESSIDVSGDYFKYNNIPRSMSLTYCGSETESEIYAPYSFYGSESEVTEDDHDWIQNGRTHKLRSRKGRSIVHKNLEDNYGAVIVANHEALAQVLENIQQINHIQPALRGLKTSPNLRWTDFSLNSSIPPVTVGQRVFHQALWGSQHVTLVVNVGSATSCSLSLGTFSLPSVTEFNDLIPNSCLPLNEYDENKQIQATVAVLPWLQVNTVQSFSDSLKHKSNQTHEDTWKDASFVMLQFVNALKTLQAQGIEELPLSLKSFVLCKEMEKETSHRLCVLQGLGSEVAPKTDDKYGTLCMCALKALMVLQPTAKNTPLIQSLLNNERAVSLTQVKSILEFSLWGPSDVALGSTIRERELALQRWLDLQRATVLHGLVCTRVQLTVYEEFHLLFLVRSNARMMCDASLLIESSNMKHSVTNGHK